MKDNLWQHRLGDVLVEYGMQAWSEQLHEQLNDFKAKLAQGLHGDYPRWLQSMRVMPTLSTSGCQFDNDVVTIGDPADCPLAERQQLTQLLKQFMPWRKGPFSLFGILIDSEWQSQMKWQRLQDQISPLHNRLVLDVGCGNGYYAYRMIGQGARAVIGLDPSVLFAMQFHVMDRYVPNSQIDILPFKLEQLSRQKLNFDTIFSMGVIYHRKSPQDHLQQLYHYLSDEGELVLETLVLPDQTEQVLYPQSSYAKMKNVWSIPSVPTLIKWLQSAGFDQVRLVDMTATTSKEQRVTPWMNYQSLADFLDPNDNNLTIEGYPSPLRASLVAHKSSATMI